MKRKSLLASFPARVRSKKDQFFVMKFSAYYLSFWDLNELRFILKLNAIQKEEWKKLSFDDDGC